MRVEPISGYVFLALLIASIVIGLFVPSKLDDVSDGTYVTARVLEREAGYTIDQSLYGEFGRFHCEITVKLRDSTDDLLRIDTKDGIRAKDLCEGLVVGDVYEFKVGGTDLGGATRVLQYERVYVWN